MDKVARLSDQQRSELFSETAARKRTTSAVMEKDFWVTWVLDRLFQQPELARMLMFKGGTSLSKVYRLIERFSEDIDLILDWRVLSDEMPLAERSKGKQEKLNKIMNARAKAYIGGELLALVTEALDGICRCEVERDDLHVINIHYPAAFPDVYLRPEVRLEIGPLAAWLRYGVMEFFATASVRTDVLELQRRLSISDFPRWCASVSEVFSDAGARGEIYCVWGRFRVHREDIRDGVRFTLPGCPNALQWTVTTAQSPEPNKVVIHLTINRSEHDPDFVESNQQFVADWASGLQVNW